MTRSSWFAPALLSAALTVAGCGRHPAAPGVGGGGPPDGGAPDGGAGTPYPWAAENPIDQAMRPLFEAAGLEPRPASAAELCRRVSADTRGFIPTPDEVQAHCAGKSPSEIVQYFMSTPEFVAEQQRQWIQALELDPGKLFAQELLEVDPLVEKLARGSVDYDQFAVTLAGLPAVATNVLPRTDMRQDPPRFDEAAARMFRLFRGRAPVASEKSEFAKLYAFWQRTLVNDPQLSVACGNQRYSPELAPEACTTALGPVGCTATLGGKTIRIQLPAGHVTWESFGGNVPAAVRAELDKPGRWLVDDDQFWDAAATRALGRLLGWFQSTRNVYESDLPTVRTALAAWFKARPQHAWPELMATVMTSVLYAQSAEYAAAMDRPSWAAAPTKFLSAEGLLRSLGQQVLGRTVGFCDAHTNEPIGSNVFFPDRFRKAQPADFYGFGFDFFQTYGAMLGGCQGGVAPPAQPTLARVFAEPTVMSLLATDGAARLGPDGWTADGSDASLQALGDSLAQRALGRSLGSDEVVELVAAAAGCRADPACAANPLRAAQSLATSILISAEAGTY